MGREENTIAGRDDETQDLASKLHHGKEESCTQNRTSEYLLPNDNT